MYHCFYWVLHNLIVGQFRIAFCRVESRWSLLNWHRLLVLGFRVAAELWRTRRLQYVQVWCDISEVWPGALISLAVVIPRLTTANLLAWLSLLLAVVMPLVTLHSWLHHQLHSPLIHLSFKPHLLFLYIRSAMGFSIPIIFHHWLPK